MSAELLITGSEELAESINSIFQNNFLNFIGGSINTEAVVEHAKNMLEKCEGVSAANAWQAVDWSTESTRKHVWLTALGGEGQTKAFRFRSLRLARVYAKRRLSGFVFCDLSYTPVQPTEFIMVNFKLGELERGAV